MRKTKTSKTQINMIWFVALMTVIFCVNSSPAQYSIPGNTEIYDLIDGVYILKTDVDNTIEIVEDGLTLDGVMHQIVGPGTPKDIGVNLDGREGVTIKNVKVNGFYYGINLMGSTNCTLTNIEASSNREGIHLQESNNNNITNCSVMSNGSDSGGGIILAASNGNTVENNCAELNGFTQIALYNSNDNTVRNNTTSTGYAAIFIEGSNNLLANNTTSDAYQGIYIESLDSQHGNNMINANTLYSNSYSGVHINGSNNNTLTENSIFDNGIGVHVGWVDGTMLLQNAVSSNEYNGIYVMGGQGTVVTGNTVQSNGENGIEVVWGASDTTIEGNTSSNNSGTGLLLYECISTNVIGNTLSGNLRDGIVLDATESNTLTQNMISDNDKGIVLTDTIDSTLSENTITDNFSVNLLLNAEYHNNSIFNNNFIAPPGEQQVWVWTYVDSSNVFNLDKPIGGNYWSDWCPPDHPDANGDGFVDEPYIIGKNEAQDNLPLAIPWGNTAPEVTILNPCSGYVQPICTDIILEGEFTDPDSSDSHTAVWTLKSESWEETFDGTVLDNSIIDTMQFDHAGIYWITLSVTDNAGAIGTANTVDGMPAYIVIYDPEGGFVTGGGWIYSELGAYIPDETLEGKANFGFVSKYKKGADVPTGNTEFVFNAGNLNFHSSSYDWLVVTGSNYARFKGAGTINGSGGEYGEYKFMLWAGDEPDTFRIIIWEEDESGEEFVVYDNGFDQEIMGGNIIIHTN